MSKGTRIALWTVSALLAALFLFAGATKLMKPDMARQMFAQFGYAAWFAMFIGICEALGGIALLLPRLAGLSAVGLAVIMVGAVFTVVTHHMAGQAIVPLVVLGLLVWVAMMRLKEARGLLAPRPAESLKGE